MENFFANGWLERSLVAQLEAEGTNAHRIFTSRNAWIERLHDAALISYKDSADLAGLQEELRNWAVFCGVEIKRIFGRFLTTQNDERKAADLLWGDAGESTESVVRENGVNYGVDFSAGYSVGLFLDQRANRMFVRDAQPRRLLNTFSYTCSFSVVAGKAGAQTVSIDLSARSLQRGKANFALNDLSLEGHRFLADDAMEVMPRLIRKMELFDCIILDPPTFSRGAKGRKFQVEQNFGDLLRLALNLAAPQAKILLSTNCTRLDVASLQTMAKGELRVAQRRAQYHATTSLLDFPNGEGAATIWLLLD